MAFAASVAREAGDIMRHYFYHTERLNVETKSDKTPVTIADKQINDLLIERVQSTYPDHGVLGEENSWQPERGQLWVCDPIDGTRSFIIGEPASRFSLAYAEDGVPLAAVAYDPFQDRLFSATKGGGAFCNDQPIHVSDRSLAAARIAGPGSMKELYKGKAVYDALQASGAYIRLSGGIVVQACLVADGHIDGRLFPGRSAHDIASVKLIVEEAGGKVTDLDGREQRYDGRIRGAIISNGVIHDELARAMAEFGAENFLGY
jgi:fructose-1,6-bisphosphatase/inositol monophosphatase family enzyme